MKSFHRMIAVSALPLLASLLAFPARAETGFDVDSAKRINAANDLVRDGKYDQALASYGEVNPTTADRAELDYNRAVAHYRSGDIDSARSAFEQASTSTTAPLAAAARYNLGNCFYTDATHIVEQDPAAAIDALQQAIDHYRGALASDPNLVDARANIELASEWIKRLQQQEKQQQQQQQQNHADKDQQSDKKRPPDADQQSDADQQADKDQQPGAEQQSDKEQSDKEQQSDKDQQPGAEQQSGKDQQSGNASKENSESEQSQANQDQQPATEQAPPSHRQPNRGNTTSGDDQQESGAEPKSDEQQPAEQAPVPSGELTPAGQPDDDQRLPAAGAMGEPNANATPMTKVEALKMLQAVRDRDMLRRLRQQQNQRNQHIPIDRDW